MTATDLERGSRRYTRTFVAILICGLAASAAATVVVDPFGVLGTSHMRSDVIFDREVKPELYLTASPAPQAIILGSSKVMKLSPACVTELTGMPAFNFGFQAGNVEDWDAVMRFIADHKRGPIRELLIGIDLEAFDNHSSHQLELSRYLQRYTANPGLSWTQATRALFGEESFLHSLKLLWMRARSQSLASFPYIAPDGLRVEPTRDGKGGDRTDPALVAHQVEKFTKISFDSFDELNPARLEQFRAVVHAANAAGVTIEAFVMPMSPAVEAARAKSQAPRRMAELERLLSGLEEAGQLRYHRVSEFVDIAADPQAFSDGVHPTAATARRILLRIFHRDRGCGL